MQKNSSKSIVRRAGTALAASTLALGLTGLGGCASGTHRPDEAARMVGEATGLDQPVELITVGPDGGPIDEPEADGGVLSLAHAVRRAVTTSPALQAALSRVRIAQADADQARLLPNPILNLVMRWGPGKPQIEVSLAQDFVQALQIPRKSSASDNRLRQAAAEAIVVAIDVVSETQERYAGAQANSALVSILRERLELVDKLVEIARARLAAGEGTRSDLALLQSQRAELSVELDQAILSEREERLRLARLVGSPSSAAAWRLDQWAPPAVESQPESRSIDAALMHRPELQAIAWKLKALGDDEALARLLPWDGASVGVDLQRDDKWFGGPSVSTAIPVFDTGQAKRARVSAEQLEARHELTLARRKVVEEVRVAHSALQASTANLSRIRTELIPSQEQRRAMAEASFRAGQTDATALYLAEQELRLARARAIEGERQVSIARVRLERAIGGPGVMAETKAKSGRNPALSATATEQAAVVHP